MVKGNLHILARLWQYTTKSAQKWFIHELVEKSKTEEQWITVTNQNRNKKRNYFGQVLISIYLFKLLTSKIVDNDLDDNLHDSFQRRKHFSTF